jgi:transcriptional antiterminator NusG
MGDDMAEAQWYVVHTYSGYENKVKVDLEKTIENRKLQDVIMEVSVPLLDSIEVKNGVRKKVQKKMLPGYVLVRMIMNDDTWYVVRNTRGVTGFVGPGSKPVPLTEQEVYNMGINRENEEFEFVEGETVTVINGAWINTQGVIKAINPAKQTLTITVEMFGRETPVEIAFEDVKVEHF